MRLLAPQQRFTVYHPEVRRVRWGDIDAPVSEVWWLDAEAENMAWDRMRGRHTFFVRPVMIMYEIPAAATIAVVRVPEAVSHEVLHHFERVLLEVGARFKRGEAADLIFLAQLTPSQLAG